jgi:ribosome-associated protein
MNDSFTKKIISELDFDFIRSDGPGGQNVNKVSTTVKLHFDIPNSRALSAMLKKRLFNIAKNKINKNGTLTLTSRKYRAQARNRKEVIDRFLILIHSSRKVLKKRISTQPTQASQEKRILTKKKHGDTKRIRSFPVND